MTHQCPYCLEYKNIQGFHDDPEDMICKDCKADEYHSLITKAFVLQQRQELKNMLKELDKQEELPF